MWKSGKQEKTCKYLLKAWIKSRLLPDFLISTFQRFGFSTPHY